MEQKRKVQLLASSVIIALLCEDDAPPKRSCWVDDINLTREKEGMFAKLNCELRSNPRKFRNYLRMDANNFDYLVSCVSPLIQKSETNFRKSISPAERLAVTLRYLASGSSMRSLSYEFRMSKTIISKLIPETCDAIYQVLKGEYLKVSTYLFI